MLLASQLALVAIDPVSGRHSIGIRDSLNACLAGLLIAEHQLAVADDRTNPVLDAAGEVLADKRGKVKAALSHMSRGLEQRLGTGTWDTVVKELVTAGVLRANQGSMRPRNQLLRPDVRGDVVARLQRAAAGDDQLDLRTALVLSMTGPAQLLEVVAPDRKSRKHARKRIDHALDDANLSDVTDAVRKVLADAQTAAIGAAVVASTAAVASAS